MPKKSCPYHGTTKKLHILSFYYILFFTLDMPYCVIVVLLYVFNWMFLFLITIMLYKVLSVE